ncbi:hypothetical protein [Natrinema versiforme]|uniref:Helix-hairpin-helix domain-containing protein n=1 Tax=Natrinema versiforme JCM 10478 TaxID=1227496 RepID=L9Y9F3_9EURY|nr:hypothetical protein [Natrinema versiforme]ELY70342.1 hypothetical protein C489_02661 [Natrinema versiforme JCM 10478]
MSKKDVVTDAGTGTPAENEGEGSHIVDIGITVDVSDDGNGVADAGGHEAVELEFDEDDLLEATDAAADAAAGSVSTLESTATAARGAIEPAESDALEAVDIDPETIADKEYSYRMLLDRGVDEPIADTLRRRYSLPWSFESDGDLDRRSDEVRGLGDAEREWIAVSGDDDWQAFEYEHSEPISVGRERPSERPYPKPTPITAVTGVGPDDADALAEAGVRSAERLAAIDAMAIARALDLNVLHVRTWRHNARELLGD